MSSSPPTLTTTPPLALPVPGWLFFIENLPLMEMAPAAIEETIAISIESHAPLPLEQLSYGWIADAAKKNITYYAGARERLRPILNGDYERVGYLLPDFALAPTPTSVWQWLATPNALTAIRIGNNGLEIRSWQITPPTPEELFPTAKNERALREPKLHGEHSSEILFWNGTATKERGKILTVDWQKDATAQILTVEFPLETLWHADIRDRAWLANSRKTRANTIIFNRLIIAAAAAICLVLFAGVGLSFKKKAIKIQSYINEIRAAEVVSLREKETLIGRLDQMDAGQVPFLDALATMNHYRPTEILFTRAIIDGNRGIQVTGTAATIGQINTYIESLRNNGAFSNVSPSRIATNEGRTTFDIKLTVGKLDVTHSTPTSEIPVRNFATDANGNVVEMTPPQSENNGRIR